MPLFEYRCRCCNHEFETIVRSSREEITCPYCKGAALEKQLSVFRAPAAGKDASTTATGGGCACTPQTCGCH